MQSIRALLVRVLHAHELESAGQALTIAQDLNRRDQVTTRAYYTRLILLKGISDGVRSEVMAVPGLSAGEPVWLVIAGATMIEAAYAAFEHPEAKALRQLWTWV